MELNFVFLFNSIMLGIGLAMDAFSVSLANGLNEPEMRGRKMGFVALVFALFQGAMPMIGWICVHTVMQYFTAFEKMIPWIALILLCYIGGNMIKDCFCGEEEDCCRQEVNLSALMVQGVATSIDALSVGFTIAEYNMVMAFLAAAIIAFVTFFICFAGIAIGKKAGTKLAGKAGLFGGAILIFIGFEIFITSFF